MFSFFSIKFSRTPRGQMFKSILNVFILQRLHQEQVRLSGVCSSPAAAAAPQQLQPCSSCRTRPSTTFTSHLEAFTRHFSSSVFLGFAEAPRPHFVPVLTLFPRPSRPTAPPLVTSSSSSPVKMFHLSSPSRPCEVTLYRIDRDH